MVNKFTKLIYNNIIFLVIFISYFVIIMPISIITQIFQIDLLDLKKNKKKTYWIIEDYKKSNMQKQR
jgi:hypothetical protein